MTTPSREPLDQLEGKWNVSGTIRARPIAQSAEGRWTLRRSFFELHFVGTVPSREGMPPYEARVFIGWDSNAIHYVSHWLDVFGPGPSVTLGYGSRTTDGLVLTFDYAGGPFRDTLTFDSETDEWRLLIEMRGGDGAWSVFADERLTRSDAGSQ